MVTITVLTDNTAGSTYLAEHGLSYLIETGNEKILFDTGHSDVFLKNAAKLGINIETEIQQIVLSHGHWDHGDGLQYLNNKRLLTHPGSFIKRYRKRDHSYIGLKLSEKELREKFDVKSSASPVEIINNFWFLGEIPRENDFESKTTPFELEDYSDDFIPDDTALAAIENNELVIITGCSHSGICNICEYAKKVSGVSKIKAVIGGFHLKLQNEQTQRTIEYFKANSIENLIPSHCTELPALAAFYDTFKIPQVRTGMKFEF